MAMNKGEWSEVYTFLKLLADGKLYAADADLNKISEIYYPILQILRDENGANLIFDRQSEIKIVDVSGKELLCVPLHDFKNKSSELLAEIKNAKAASFEVPLIENFMRSIHVKQLKAKSQEKRDITIVVHDIFTGYNPTLGFSIKSKLGGASTLLNASGATNFIFKLTRPLSEEQTAEVNGIDSKTKIRDRILKIESFGSSLEFYKMQSENFERNLVMIDSKFPEILSQVLKNFYKGEANTISDAVEKLNIINPLGYDVSSNHPFYAYKIKNFLTDCALGMTPATLWTGKYDANGGYIIVKEDGEILCYHIYNRNEFQEYLFSNTKLETPSSTKHGFATVYEEDGTNYFKLNLQIRFK